MTPRCPSTIDDFIISAIVAILLTITPSIAGGQQQLLLSASNEKQESSGQNRQDAGSDLTNGKSAEMIVAELSDEQVRRLLIEELRKQTRPAQPMAEDESGALVRFIGNIRFLTNLIQWRIYELRSDVGTDPDDMPRLYRLLSKGERDQKPDSVKTIASVAGLLAAGLMVFWLFRRFLAAFYHRIENNVADDWKAKIAGQALRSLLDLLCMLVFAGSGLAFFFIFMQRSGPQSVLVATYMVAFLIVMAAQLLTRFFLAPNVPSLRFLPLDDGTATYLNRWILGITVVGTFGFLTCGIFRVAGVSEANHLMMVAAIELVIVVMIITMVIQKREQVKSALAANLPGRGLRSMMVNAWHRLAIAALLLLWVMSSVNLLLFGIRPGAPGIQTLLIIPLYFLLDWALREILRVVFGITVTVKSEVESETSASAASDTRVYNSDGTSAENKSDSASVDAEIESSSEPVIKKYMDGRRLNRIIGSGLRIALAVFIFLYLLEIWGIDVQFGRVLTRAVVNILVAVLICYVAWELISAAIQRRLQVEMPEDEDDDKEEGGAGGSRIGTLLLLLRKFMLAVLIIMAVMIILSSIGVNIGPMIAGAGVVGLAIGFGSQTLVKDIIAGVFFLIDDAFRVGDYIQAAGTKGMVEHISLRSLRLRHPRGMVNTIPFGDIGTVTNMSRDYIITKLDFRVRYDTNVEKVRKIIKKKVYKQILKNEELAPKLLDKIKSQGVREMDDSAMIMRVKFKTIPGEQFVIRKEVYRLMQEAFREEGIEFAHRNVTVYIPPEAPRSASDQEQENSVEPSTDSGDPGRTRLEKAGAAAALAVAQAEEEAKKRPK